MNFQENNFTVFSNGIGGSIIGVIWKTPYQYSHFIEFIGSRTNTDPGFVFERTIHVQLLYWISILITFHTDFKYTFKLSFLGRIFIDCRLMIICAQLLLYWNSWSFADIRAFDFFFLYSLQNALLVEEYILDFISLLFCYKYIEYINILNLMSWVYALPCYLDISFSVQVTSTTGIFDCSFRWSLTLKWMTFCNITVSVNEKSGLYGGGRENLIHFDGFFIMELSWDQK
jgi:hypothetical protein